MIKINFTCKSLKGKYRITQQDKVLAVRNKENFYLFAICDGIGGQSHGETASKIAIKTLKYVFKKSFFQDFNDNEFKQWINLVFHKICQKMYFYESSNTAFKGMGTTCVLGIVVNDKIYVASSGDSRFYLYNGDLSVFRQITTDHNIQNKTNNYEKTNIINELHDLRGNYTFWKLLTSSLNSRDDFQIDFQILPFQKHKIYVLTSDGLHDYVSKNNFQKILSDKQLSLKQQERLLFAMAEQGMSNDNMSLILIKKE